MKITFQTSDAPEAGKQYVEKPYADRHHAAGNKNTGRSTGVYQADACQVDFRRGTEKNWLPGGAGEKGKGKSLIEMQQEAAVTDASIQQNYMTVMSNTMSEEDYARLSEEGFHFAGIDPETAVTIVDKIKAELALSGQVIVGYTDDLDVDTLAAAVGSETLARAVADSFRQADIPLTEENIDKIKQAWDMASGLKPPADGVFRYMVDNGMQPEIWDFYLAGNSGAQAMGQEEQAGGGYSQGGSRHYYAEEIQGYYTQSADICMEAGLQEQVDKVIAQSDLALNEQSRQSASWLMERGLPLTAENLERLADLQKASFPVTEEAFAKAVACAVAEGKAPIHGNLSQPRNIYERAEAVLAHYQSDADWESLGGDITARKQLEEIRLRMTAEVNVKLLKSGFSIDTAPMEQLLEALKQAESQVADAYFPGDVQAVEKYQAYSRTNQAVRELPGVPAQMVGTYSMREGEISLARFHEEGKALQESYERANESYEALMTAPRSDLGDSIRKAFANVDDIVKDLNLQLTEENRRAVRILGYNRMEITVENISRVRDADRQVQDMISKMTPASILKMIRDGINPLEKSFTELGAYFEENSESYEESAESYSRFLYGMERQHDITEEERTAYIGVYRMLYQIEHSDGAAVGALVNSHAQLQFSNLLSAVRSGKFRHMDVKVEDAFGAVASVVRKGESISEQIAKGFARDVKDILTEVSYSEESDAAYNAEELSRLREAAHTDAEAISLLQRGEVAANADNLLAAQALLQEDANLFQEIDNRVKGRRAAQGESRTGQGGMSGEAASEAAKASQGQETLQEENAQISWTGPLDSLGEPDAFQAAYGQMVEELQELVQDASISQADASVDVRGFQMINKQLAIAGKLARSEEYILPMYIGDSLAKVHLTLERGSAEKGGVHIAVALPRGGQIEAHFSMKGNTLEGILAGNTEEEVMKLKQTADIFSDYISGNREGMGGISLERMPVVSREGYAAWRAGTHPAVSPEKMRGTEAAQVKTEGTDNIELYNIAKAFLHAVREEEVV